MKESLFRLALGLLATTPALAQDYAIRLHQPLKVDQRYKFTTVAHESSQKSMTAKEKVLRNEKEELTVEMESVVTVLEVDSIGRPTKQSHILVKLVRVQGTTKEPVLAAGTKVIAFRANQKTVFEIEDKPPAPEVAKALELAVTITSGGPSDDEIFGTTERKKVGDSWDINEELALKDMKNNSATQMLGIEKVSGKTTLQKVTKDGDVDVLHLAANVTAQMATASIGPFASPQATMQATMTGAFPADAFSSVMEEGATMTMTFKASGKPDANGPNVLMTGTMQRSASTKKTLLKN